MQKYISGGLILLCGAALSVTSAAMSYQGYDRAFPDLHGAGVIGLAIAGLAFACAGAIAVANSQGAHKAKALAIVMAVVFSGGDVMGNWLATSGQTEAKIAAATQAKADFTAADTALAVVRERTASAEAKLSIVSGDDIKAAQRLLKAEGRYAGKIDGVPGGLTEAAMFAFGADLRSQIASMSAEEAQHAETVAKPVPAMPGQHAQAIDLAVAIALTVFAFFASLLGSSLMTGKDDTKERATEARIAELEARLEAARQMSGKVRHLTEALKRAA